MMGKWRDSLWPRILALHDRFDRIADRLAALDPGDDGVAPLRHRFRRSLDALIEARGAFSHGEYAFLSWLRLGPLEQDAGEFEAMLGCVVGTPEPAKMETQC